VNLKLLVLCCKDFAAIEGWMDVGVTANDSRVVADGRNRISQALDTTEQATVGVNVLEALEIGRAGQGWLSTHGNFGPHCFYLLLPHMVTGYGQTKLSKIFV
jgi:hypothetical protein